MFNCEKCGSSTRAMVTMCVSAPSEMMHKFSKRNMRSKEFTVWGVNWDTADFTCTNEKCRHVTNGYGNYVKNLIKTNEELTAVLKELSKHLPLTVYNNLLINDIVRDAVSKFINNKENEVK